MKKIKLFSEFINEVDEFKLDNPADDGNKLADVLVQNKSGVEVGNNSGSFVNKVQRSVGITDGQPWCMAFVYYIFDEFSKKMGVKNPVYKTGSVLQEWEKTGGKKITAAEARSNFSLVKPGQIMIAEREGGGHAGIITSVDYNDKKFTTVEGNVRINANKTQGVGGYNRSVLVNGLIGFIDYFPNRTPEFDKGFTDAIKGKITDKSNNIVNRNLPGDEIIGGEDASSNSAEEVEKKDSTSGGILGKIISGARKFYNPNDSADDDISAEATSKAFASIGK